MKGEKVVISPYISEEVARDEIARRALMTEPKTPRHTPEDRVIDELNKLTAYETCCILGAMRNRLGRDLPIAQIYQLAVREFVGRYWEMTHARD